jgi:hypothetical protein
LPSLHPLKEWSLQDSRGGSVFDAGEAASSALNGALSEVDGGWGDEGELGADGDRPFAEASGSPSTIGSPDEFEPSTLMGLTPEDVTHRIPSDWVKTPSRTGGGAVFRDPENLGRQIRLMPGYGEGARPDPLTSGPYAVVSQNGIAMKVPLAGNPTLP